MAEPRDNPLMGRRTLLRGLLLGGGLAGLAACGVPGHSSPHIVGAGPSPGGPDASRIRDSPTKPDNIRDPQDFVKAFLTAVASPPDDLPRGQAIDNARSFMTVAARAKWQPDAKQINVVRLVNVSSPAVTSTGQSVTVEMVTVGQLGANGFVAPPAQFAGSTQATFALVRNADPTSDIIWLLDGPLPAPLANNLLLSADGLSSLYGAHLVYFWDLTGTAGLVPDLRYLPYVNLAEGLQPTTIVNWLINGPSDWLAPGVTALPSIRLVLPNVARDPADNTAWLVNFVSLQGADPAHVAAQVRVSLLPNVLEPVEVKVGSQDKLVDGTDLMKLNLADKTFRPADPVGYFVVNGQVREIVPPYNIPPVFSKVTEPGMASASMSRDLKLGAFVRQANGRCTLSIGRLKDDGAEVTGTFQDTQLSTSGAMSRPVWLASSPARVLVAANNALYSVDLSGQATQVAINGSVDMSVSAFSVAPDARRIALISGGRVAVASLTFTAETVAVGPPSVIDSGGLTELTAVAWSRVHWLALAGRSVDGRQGLLEVSVDGALSQAISSPAFGSKVTQLASYPPLPSRGLTLPGPIMVQTLNSGARQVSQNNADLLVYNPPIPSPSPSAGANPPANHDIPLSPFFLD